MFTPVRGEQLSHFDAETIALFKRRESNPLDIKVLSHAPRPQRNFLPVALNPRGQDAQKMERYGDYLWLKIGFGFLYFSWACHEFAKIYFPHGLILQRSNPVSWPRYFRQRLPILSVFAYTWYFVKEMPRRNRIDLSDPFEL
eukprot:403366478